MALMRVQMATIAHFSLFLTFGMATLEMQASLDAPRAPARTIKTVVLVSGKSVSRVLFLQGSARHSIQAPHRRDADRALHGAEGAAVNGSHARMLPVVTLIRQFSRFALQAMLANPVAALLASVRIKLLWSMSSSDPSEHLITKISGGIGFYGQDEVFFCRIWRLNCRCTCDFGSSFHYFNSLEFL